MGPAEHLSEVVSSAPSQDLHGTEKWGTDLQVMVDIYISKYLLGEDPEVKMIYPSYSNGGGTRWS